MIGTVLVASPPLPADVGPGVVLLLALEAAGGVLLVSLLGVAALRRRERPYVLLTLGASTLLLRAIVGFLAIAGLLGGHELFTIDHGLDVVLLALIAAAVYTAREVEGQGVVE